MLLGPLGYILMPTERGGPNKGQWVPNNLSLIYDILLLFVFFERKNWRKFLVVPHKLVAL
jgi:hypothetical protein